MNNKKRNIFGYRLYSKSSIKMAEDKINLLGVDNKYSAIFF